MASCGDGAVPGWATGWKPTLNPVNDRKPAGPARKEWWTEARREQARDFWTAERRAFEAMKRKLKPQGCYSSAYWTAEKRAEQAERLRRHHARTLDDVAAAFEQVDRVRRLLRGGM